MWNGTFLCSKKTQKVEKFYNDIVLYPKTRFFILTKLISVAQKNWVPNSLLSPKCSKPTRSTIINFLSFEKKWVTHSFTPIYKNWVRSWSSLFSKDCTLFSFIFFFKFQLILWVLNFGIEVCHFRHKIVSFFLRISSQALLCTRVFEPKKSELNV